MREVAAMPLSEKRAPLALQRWVQEERAVLMASMGV
jgi:hypothetical protein